MINQYITKLIKKTVPQFGSLQKFSNQHATAVSSETIILTEALPSVHDETRVLGYRAVIRDSVTDVLK